MEAPVIETRWMCIECHKEEIAPHTDYCSECTEKLYSRIDGWLWLPLISLFLFIVSGIYSLLDYYTVLNDGYALPRNMMPTLHIMAITDILYIAGAIITLTFFFKALPPAAPRFYRVHIVVHKCRSTHFCQYYRFYPLFCRAPHNLTADKISLLCDDLAILFPGL